MTQSCEWKEIVFSASIFALPAVFGAGVTWLTSSATAPLVSAVFTSATLVSALGLYLLFKNKVKDWDDKGLLLAFFVVNVGVSLLFTALGFSISVPLSLLLAATSAVGMVTSLFILGK